MNLNRTFLFLSLFLTLISVCSHELASEQYVFMALTPVLLAITWRAETSGRPLRLPEPLPTLLTLAVFLVVMFRGIDRESLAQFGMFDVRVATIGKFLIAFQWISLFREKTARDHGWLYLVTVIQMGIAGLLMPTLGYGALLLVYALTGIAALTVFHLWAQAHAAGADVEHEVKVSRGLLLSAIPMTLLLLPPVIGVFVALPRTQMRFVTRMGRLGAGPVAGFSNTVQLGAVGTIQDNPTRVMTVIARNPETEQPVRLAEFLFRGIALETYERRDGVWTWHTEGYRRGLWTTMRRPEDGVSRLYSVNFPEFERRPYQLLRLDVTMEQITPSLLFTVFPAERLALSDRSIVSGSPMLHLFLCRPAGAMPYDYTVYSRLQDPLPDGAEAPPATSDVMLAPFLRVPSEISPRVRELAATIAPRDLPPRERAQRIFNYLSDSSRFAYTLNMEPTAGVEPVEDFLFNRQIGHCEYFASSMAVLLRCAGVPCRMVNGFKVSEYDEDRKRYIVRQSNAHSWVEAYVRPDGWRTYDPSVQRDAVVEPISGTGHWFQDRYDDIETMWLKYVVNYSSESQFFFYRTIRRWGEAARWFWIRSVMLAGGDVIGKWDMLWRSLVGSLNLPLNLFALACGLVILGMVLYHTIVEGLAVWRRREVHATITYYRRMEAMLMRRGLHRRSNETPWEFHRMLVGRGRPEARLVGVITDGFCRVRYGGAKLEKDELEIILDALREIRGMHGRKRKAR